MPDANEPNIIDNNLPVCTEEGRLACILKVVDDVPRIYPLIGVIETKDFRFEQEEWDYLGNPMSGNSSHRIINKPGYAHTHVWINVLENGTTGYGYKTKELAEDYAIEDSHGEPIRALVQQTIIFKTKD